MTTPALTDLLVKKLEHRDTLSAEEKRVLESAVARVRVVEARADIVSFGQRVSDSCLLMEGLAARYKTLGDGSRQITDIHVAGDFVDLHSFLLHTMDHGVAALSNCKIAVVPHAKLRAITETHPHLTRVLWLGTLIDGAIHREWLVAMGRMQALGHVAHLICEIYTRLKMVGLVSGFSFDLPITQSELGDAVGLSTVHSNRTVQELRSQGLLTWTGSTVTITDWDRLSEVAQFDPVYLHLEREPR